MVAIGVGVGVGESQLDHPPLGPQYVVVVVGDDVCVLGVGSMARRSG
jgi:hypothetical protein